VGADDRAGGAEAQADALLAGGAGLDAAIERGEHPLQLVGLEARAPVADLDHGLVALEMQGHAGAVAVLDGVVHEVGEHPLQAQDRDLDLGRVAGLQGHVGAGDLGLVDHAFQQRAQVDPLAGAGLGVVAHEGQDRGDHRLHLVQVLADLAAQRGRGALQPEAQAGQGRAQVVRDGADHRRAVGDVAAQPALHGVEGPGGAADLGGPVGDNDRRGGVAAQLLGGGGEAGQGRGQAAGEDPAQRGHHGQGQGEPHQHPALPAVGEGLGLGPQGHPLVRDRRAGRPRSRPR
jgi:hypothetical protein